MLLAAFQSVNPKLQLAFFCNCDWISLRAMALGELLLESLLMAAGTYAIGTLPLFAKSRASLGSTSGISIFSVGLLVSTSLSVIIPEGVAVVLKSVQAGKEGEGEGEVHEHTGDTEDIGPWIGAALCAGFLLM